MPTEWKTLVSGMLAGKYDISTSASITSNLEASKLTRTYPQLTAVLVDRPRSPADLAFITPQNDQVWINYLNHWISIKTNRGFFQGLQNKWMPSN